MIYYLNQCIETSLTPAAVSFRYEDVDAAAGNSNSDSNSNHEKMVRLVQYGGVDPAGAGNYEAVGPAHTAGQPM